MYVLFSATIVEIMKVLKKYQQYGEKIPRMQAIVLCDSKKRLLKVLELPPERLVCKVPEMPDLEIPKKFFGEIRVEVNNGFQYELFALPSLPEMGFPNKLFALPSLTEIDLVSSIFNMPKFIRHSLIELELIQGFMGSRF